MAEDHAGPVGPDLARGISLAELTDGGKLVGHVADEQVLLVRRGLNMFAIGAHYNGPLADGLIVDDTVRCPWHHACFGLRTGEALRAPAFSPVVEAENSRKSDAPPAFLCESPSEGADGRANPVETPSGDEAVVVEIQTIHPGLDAGVDAQRSSRPRLRPRH